MKIFEVEDAINWLFRFCEFTNTSASDIMGKRRLRHVMEQRRKAAKFLRSKGYSFPVIGAALGGRDHSTAINLVKNG